MTIDYIYRHPILRMRNIFTSISESNREKIVRNHAIITVFIAIDKTDLPIPSIREFATRYTDHQRFIANSKRDDPK